MFEITGDDIAALNDVDLRTLIGRLCEAELRRKDLPVSAVTWGGNQTAKDGGLDVRVTLPDGAPIDGFIPQSQTGFQVKKPDMPRAEILDEMKPSGVVRAAIVELAKLGGAYIIVSANGSTADLALNNRRDAMKEAVKDIAEAAKLTLDFYDRNRVASWVRDHAGMIPWVRSRIGKSVPGWHSYGSWSHPPEGVDARYLTDDQARVRTGDKDEGGGLRATDGINRMRNALREPGQVVRLVGLSGVGKTRLVEALFDTSVGENSLDPSLAVYTNVAEGPDPQPPGLASDLIAAGTRAILVIDNCPPDLHRQLSEIARSKGTTISVITIEYDIREDQPEGTDVFVLETSSLSLIEKLVGQRYPSLSRIDAQTIAEFSGGNARVALALASRIEKTETVSGLSEAELFKRLFQQRHDHDPTLYSIAQACSLVYSFEGERISGEEAELPVLGGLIGKTPEDVYAGAAELKRRDLLQERGPWRAVLPHAIANRLAATALTNIPPPTIVSALVDNASERLLRSFSRRLGLLDTSPPAKIIVTNWLKAGGLLADLTNLDELGRAILANIAPVAPEAVLSAIETALSGADEETLRRCTHLIRLLRSFAYEEDYFERAVALLAEFARHSGDDASDDAASVVESLFYIFLSGTHAPVAMRLKVLNGLLGSVDPEMCALGVRALAAMLKTSHFSSTYEFSFGARSRDYGYHPKTGKDVSDWFEAVLELTGPFALSDTALAKQVQHVIASEFRGLWTNSGQADDLDTLARAIAAKSFWRDGWIAARQTRSYEGKAMPPELLSKLTALEAFLRPSDLVSQVRGIVLGDTHGNLVLDEFDHIDDASDTDDDGFAVAQARMATAIENLGKDVAADEETFKTMLPELMHGHGNLMAFGHALAGAAEKPREMWTAIVSQFAATERPDVVLLYGFLSGLYKRDSAEADAVLDEALDHAALAEWFPELQAHVAVDALGLKRLHSALELRTAPVTRFYGLAYGRACDAVSGPDFRDLILAIGKVPNGAPVALQILSMRLHADRSDKRQTVPEVIEAGQALLAAYEFHQKDGRSTREDHDLGVIAKASLAGLEGVPIVRGLCRGLMTATARHDIHAHDQDDLIAGLFKVHPEVMLDELFSGDEKDRGRSVRLLKDLLRFRKNALDGVPDEIIIDWCDRNPKIRYPLAAAVAPVFKVSKDEEPHAWRALGHMLFEKAPDAVPVLNSIIQRLHPSIWSGSLATKLESGLKLLDAVQTADGSPLKATLDEAKARLRTQIEEERRHETEQDKKRSGRFE